MQNNSSNCKSAPASEGSENDSVCLTPEVSHEGRWHCSCASTNCDSYRNWLHRIVRLIFHSFSIQKKLKSRRRPDSRNSSTKYFEKFPLRKDSSPLQIDRSNGQSTNNDSSGVASSQIRKCNPSDNSGLGNHGNQSPNSYEQISERLENGPRLGQINPRVKVILPDYSNSTPNKDACWCECNPIELNSQPHTASCTKRSKQERTTTDCIGAREVVSSDSFCLTPEVSHD